MSNKMYQTLVNSNPAEANGSRKTLEDQKDNYLSANPQLAMIAHLTEKVDKQQEEIQDLKEKMVQLETLLAVFVTSAKKSEKTEEAEVKPVPFGLYS